MKKTFSSNIVVCEKGRGGERELVFETPLCWKGFIGRKLCIQLSECKQDWSLVLSPDLNSPVKSTQLV